ncbi:esterase family protein [Sanguibacter sp. HDW7]|uniref:alpha/beta hydrolase n=1 Tax=Sanguibacter sp. HDW7 TaxID=2714931 RepID=UPI00140B481C|nr:alpha/beta hydrolase-fold protein [Sanguibacter sp. HDW7]QIK83679.1 hypothetical protein G7063_08615 [Sanguibacter sp. HDW7]
MTPGSSAPRATFVPALPPRVSPTAAVASLAGHSGDVEAFFAELAARGGAFVSDDPPSGTATVCVAHPVMPAGTEVFALVDTLTHVHRDRLEHFRLEPLAAHGAEVLAIALVLPRALRATVSLLVETGRTPSLVTDRSAWRAAYERTRALAGTTEVVRDGAGRANVHALPGAPPTPWPAREVTGAVLSPTRATRRPRAPGVHEHRFFSEVLGLQMRVRAVVPHPTFGEATAVVVVLDGERWTLDYPILDGLAHLHEDGACGPTLALHVAPEDPGRRAELLGMNAGLPRFLVDELLPWGASLTTTPTDPARRAIAGVSLGGLAAADVVRRAPDAFGNAIVQSGSFWWPGADGTEGEQLRLWHAEGPALAGRVRIFHEVGALEGLLLADNLAFRDVAAASGVQIVSREVTGGHDHAIWRVGLLDGIAHLFPSV